MTTLADIRAQYPQYKDVPDQELADGFYNSVYAGKISKEDFYKGINFTPPVPEGTDQQGFLQQMFDVRNRDTGESYLYGNKPKPTAFDDITNIMADTGQRGLINKHFGGAERVEAARKRTPDWPETAADVTASYVSTPFKVATKTGALALGGADAMLNEYGHQDGWIPNTQKEWLDIGKAGAQGSGLGWLGAKGGEIIGNIANKFRGGPKGYANTDELYDAGQKAKRRKAPGAKSLDDISRSERMIAAEKANAGGKRGFQELTESMDNFPLREQSIIANLAGAKSRGNKALDWAGKVVSGGNWWGAIPVAKATGGVAPMVGQTMRGIAEISNSLDAKQVDLLKRTILDNTGRMKTDKATVDFARDFLAKAAIGRKEPLY